MNIQITDYLVLQTLPPFNGSARAPYRLAIKNVVDRLTCRPTITRGGDLRAGSVPAQVLSLDHSATWQRGFGVILINKSIRVTGPVWIRLEPSSHPNGHSQTKDSKVMSAPPRYTICEAHLHVVIGRSDRDTAHYGGQMYGLKPICYFNKMKENEREVGKLEDGTATPVRTSRKTWPRNCRHFATTSDYDVGLRPSDAALGSNSNLFDHNYENHSVPAYLNPAFPPLSYPFAWISAKK